MKEEQIVEKNKQMLEKDNNPGIDGDIDSNNSIEIDYEQNNNELSEQIKIRKKDIKADGFNINKITHGTRFDMIKNENGTYLLKLNDENGKYSLTGSDGDGNLYFIYNAPERYNDNNSIEDSDEEIDVPKGAKAVSDDCLSNLCRKISICCANCLKNCFRRGNNESK